MRLIPETWLNRVATHETRRMAALAAGWVIMALSLPIGALPGPGGIVVFAFGLALVLRNSRWAKRQYVRFKRRWPKIGHLTDKGLGRRSARKKHGEEEAQTAAN
jgi:hypothetical protein